MPGSIPNLCPHAFYKGNGCADCIDDALLKDLLEEAIMRLSHTDRLTNDNMDFISRVELFLEFGKEAT